MQPIHDALELLSDLNMGNEHRRSADLMRSGSIVVEALSYIRGRSIASQFMVIDEAQNLTPLEAKTILTRVGQGTKIVFTGDPYQIDNPYVDGASNGSITWSAAFAATPLPRTSNSRKASAANWPSWPRTFCSTAAEHGWAQFSFLPAPELAGAAR
jgi:predicted ribonuclease YlaK